MSHEIRSRATEALRRWLMGGLVLLAAIVVALPAAAQSLIRDAEIEQTLQRLAYPLFRAAAVSPSTVRIYIVNDPEPNAFVAGGSNIFVNTGLLTELGSMDEVQAVIAHELGHLTGGHQVTRGESLAGAKTFGVLGMIGAAAATVAGSPEAGLAIMAGSSQAAMRNLLAHTRAEEAAADQSGLRYLSAAGADPDAMLRVLDHFRGQDAMLGGYNVDAYARSHPLWSERISLIEERVAKLPKGKPPSPEDDYWYRRMVAKLEAFLSSPATTLRAYPDGDTSEAARLARAVAWHRRPDPAKAVAAIDALIAIRPDDPWYNELKGQFLLETGRAAPAAAAYRRAAELAPDEPLVLAGLGRALLNEDGPDAATEARKVLARAQSLDRVGDPGMLRDLALAEARLGNDGAAALATAERFSLMSDWRDAARNAQRASDLLPYGSPGWQRAQDLVTISTRALKSSRKP
ncbi:putative Zn-dependent protease [Amaricoccus macauensis]|uniref:Putative Zn-dependent protease n=1 Tax=Amaricoccus macauensis TaxID=57001 RepID=A0A840SLM0_9RHOB|nr:M48 family metalloprotease [Amaricoccus macauensis]MBB5223999.1 putative Zn-dependent protease [Amaricoccus macauensis]